MTDTEFFGYIAKPKLSSKSQTIVNTMVQTLEAVNRTIDYFNSDDSNKEGYTKKLVTTTKKIPSAWKTSQKSYKETYILYEPISDTKQRIAKAQSTANLYLKEMEIQGQ